MSDTIPSPEQAESEPDPEAIVVSENRLREAVVAAVETTMDYELGGYAIAVAPLIAIDVLRRLQSPEQQRC